MRSIAEASPHGQSQPLVGKDIVDAWYVDQIAELLARRAYRNPRLVLKTDVAPNEQKVLRARAALALRCDDPAFDVPAIYLAADAMIAAAVDTPLLGSLPLERRQQKVALATAGIRTYRRALAGEMPGQVRALGLLAVADAQALRTAQAQS